MDFIIVLHNGAISESGTYNELVEKKGAFAEFLATYLKEDNNESTPETGLLTLSGMIGNGDNFESISTAFFTDSEKKDDTPPRENVVRQRSRSSSESASVRSVNRFE